MKTLNEAIASRSPESQQRIRGMAEELILETVSTAGSRRVKAVAKACRQHHGDQPARNHTAGAARQ